MKKSFLAGALLLVFIISFYIFFRQNKPVSIPVPAGLNAEKVLDPLSNKQDSSLYYLSEDKGYFNKELEERLGTRAAISEFYSTGFKNMSTIKKKDLLQMLESNVQELYYHTNEWWSFDSSDTCVAILKDKQGALYIASVFPAGECRR